MHGAVYTSVGWTKPRVIPPESELRKAAGILNDGAKVAMLIGQGAVGAAAEVIEVAELLGAGVAKTLLGRPMRSAHNSPIRTSRSSPSSGTARSR